MRRGFLCGFALLLLVFLFVPASSQAITIGFNPVSQTVPVGDPATVDIFISGLGDFSAPSLSTFDLDVTFDPLILGLTAVTFGDPILGDQLDLIGWGSFTGSTQSWGKVNLYELSFDLPEDLEMMQPKTFVLASLTFDTLSVGTSDLILSINALGDAYGDPLSANVQNGNISPVPEPATLLLLGSGLVGLAGFRKKFRRKRAD